MDESKIPQIYTLQDENSKLEEILTLVPEEYIQTANEIIRYAKFSLGKS